MLDVTLQASSPGFEQMGVQITNIISAALRHQGTENMKRHLMAKRDQSFTQMIDLSLAITAA